MHCTDQLLRLKWACFSLGEQFPRPGRLGKGLFPLSPSPSTPSTPGFPLGSLISIWAFWKTAYTENTQTLHVAVFLVPHACSHPSPLPTSTCLMTGRGWGLPANPLLASLQPGYSCPISAEAHPWRVLDGAFCQVGDLGR